MDSSTLNHIVQTIHWTTSEEMLFTAESKYTLSLAQDFPFVIKFYQFTAAHQVIPNYHDFYEISYIHSGRGVYHLADQDIAIQPGTIVLIQSGQMHNVDADPDDPIKSASIYFMPELIYHPGSTPYEYNYLLPFLHQGNALLPVFQENDIDVSIWEMILGMYHVMDETHDFYQLTVKNRLCEILLTFLKKKKHHLNPSTSPSAPINKIKRIDNVFDYIHTEYAKTIPLAHLAKVACMSPSYFCRYFKGVTGLSPVNYILRYRIEKSKELLINGDTSITEIAFNVGFNSQSYFDRIFQRFTKQSPNRFRQTYTSQQIR